MDSWLTVSWYTAGNQEVEVSVVELDIIQIHAIIQRAQQPDILSPEEIFCRNRVLTTAVLLLQSHSYCVFRFLYTYHSSLFGFILVSPIGVLLKFGLLSVLICAPNLPSLVLSLSVGNSPKLDRHYSILNHTIGDYCFTLGIAL